MDDIIYRFDRPLTLISVFNIVFITLKYFSAYEQARLEQIRENEVALRALGIIGARLGGGPTEFEKNEKARKEQLKKQENRMVKEMRKERIKRKRMQEEARKSPFMVVRLNGIMHSDETGEKRALEEISKQMFQNVR